MASHSTNHKPARYRQPLSDTTEWVNNQSSTPAPSEPFSTPQPHIPHHTSLKPGGNLQLPNRSSPGSLPEDKRVSAVSSGDRNANRDSQYSTASTDASKKSRRKTHVGPWHLGKTLGKGASGRVRVAKHAVTGQKAAVKIVSKRAAEMLRTESLAVMDKIAAQSGQRLIPFGIEREVVIMKLIEHPNIISLYDVWENRGELYLILEYVDGGELFHYISRNGRLPEGETIRILRQMIAGLSYCHRFKICHRDLKPENILMDRHGNIKIVDFGMAALQPANKWLTTSCGSPHYASPEVIQAQEYRGDRADIWSCGIILFAMLTGTLPFDSDGDHRDVCRLVIQGHYTIPDGLSAHAKDLIWRMLQYEPRHRIPMKSMWDHPLLKRYQSLDSLDANGNAYIGPSPPLTLIDCGPIIRDRKDIDRELLRNLQNLFHGVSEEEVTQKLLSDKPAHERVLYHKLLQFREEHLENYQGPIMEYSISDYHHHEPPPRSLTRASLQLGNRRQSQYSILHEGLPPKSQSQTHRRQPSVAGTEQSYDPYRPSSRQQMTKAAADKARITVLRGPSASSRQRTISNHSRHTSVRNPALARIQGDEAHGIPNSSSATGSPQQRQMSRGASRRSMVSTSSVRAVTRKSFSYKRNVSFIHPRRPSNPQPPLSTPPNASPHTLQESYATGQEAEATETDEVPELPVRIDSRFTADSPVPEATQIVRSKKTLLRNRPVPDIVLTRSSQYWKDDARKVSTELEKYIDEAFNRSSMQSNGTRETKETERSYNTPATTVSQRDYSASSIQQQHHRSGKVARTSDRSILERPLPDLPPPEYPGTNDFTQRELAKARDLLKQRAADPSIKKGALDDVIAHLDRLMQPSAVRIQEQERRAASTPDPKSPLEKRDDTFERFFQEGYTGIRSASEPVRRSHADNPRVRATVRMVEHSDENVPISPTKPLTIRKKSGSSTPSDRSVRIRSKSSQEQLSHVEDNGPYNYDPSRDYRSAGLTLLDRTLEPIEENEDKENYDPNDRKRKTLSGESRKRGWFRKGHQIQRSQENVKGQSVSDLSEAQERRSNPSEGKSLHRLSDPINEQIHIEPKNKAKGMFFKLFGKREGKGTKYPPKGSPGDYDLDDASSIDSITTSTRHPSAYMSGALPSTTSLSHHRSSRKTRTSTDTGGVFAPITGPPRPIQPQPQNWLARFLRIKPACHILCFRVSRVRALKATYSLLREWRKYGMRDISVDKSTSRIFARVDGERNSLRIKGVELAAEFFEVLEKGRRVKGGLAVARLTQERGAKSSFERVIRALEQVLGERGVLVGMGEEERERREGMRAVLMG